MVVSLIHTGAGVGTSYCNKIEDTTPLKNTSSSPEFEFEIKKACNSIKKSEALHHRVHAQETPFTPIVNHLYRHFSPEQSNLDEIEGLEHLTMDEAKERFNASLPAAQEGLNCVKTALDHDIEKNKYLLIEIGQKKASLEVDFENLKSSIQFDDPEKQARFDNLVNTAKFLGGLSLAIAVCLCFTHSGGVLVPIVGGLLSLGIPSQTEAPYKERLEALQQLQASLESEEREACSHKLYLEHLQSKLQNISNTLFGSTERTGETSVSSSRLERRTSKRASTIVLSRRMSSMPGSPRTSVIPTNFFSHFGLSNPLLENKDEGLESSIIPTDVVKEQVISSSIEISEEPIEQEEQPVDHSIALSLDKGKEKEMPINQINNIENQERSVHPFDLEIEDSSALLKNQASNLDVSNIIKDVIEELPLLDSGITVSIKSEENFQKLESEFQRLQAVCEKIDESEKVQLNETIQYVGKIIDEWKESSNPLKIQYSPLSQDFKSDVNIDTLSTEDEVDWAELGNDIILRMRGILEELKSEDKMLQEKINLPKNDLNNDLIKRKSLVISTDYSKLESSPEVIINSVERFPDVIEKNIISNIDQELQILQKESEVEINNVKIMIDVLYQSIKIEVDRSIVDVSDSISERVNELAKLIFHFYETILDFVERKFLENQNFPIINSVKFEEFSELWKASLELWNNAVRDYSIVPLSRSNEQSENSQENINQKMAILKKYSDTFPAILKTEVNTLSEKLKAYAYRQRRLRQDSGHYSRSSSPVETRRD